jgi:hypothetical protein
MALAERQVPPGLIHHSDRGRQYCSFVYVQRLETCWSAYQYVRTWASH